MQFWKGRANQNAIFRISKIPPPNQRPRRVVANATIPIDIPDTFRHLSRDVTK